MTKKTCLFQMHMVLLDQTFMLLHITCIYYHCSRGCRLSNIFMYKSSNLCKLYVILPQAGLSEMCRAEESWQGSSFESILKTSIRLETAETLMSLGKLDDAAFIGHSLTDVSQESHNLKLAILEQISSIQIRSGTFNCF